MIMRKSKQISYEDMKYLQENGVSGLGESQAGGNRIVVSQDDFLFGA